MTDDEGPAQQPDEFERYVRAAIARSTRVHSVAQLIRATGLHPNTVYDLFNRQVKSPGPRTIALLAEALDAPVGDLWAAWQGLEPPPDTMQEALRRHTEAMEAQTRAIRELAEYVRSAAFAIAETEATPRSPSPETRRWAQQRAEESTRPRRPTAVPEPEPER